MASRIPPDRVGVEDRDYYNILKTSRIKSLVGVKSQFKGEISVSSTSRFWFHTWNRRVCLYFLKIIYFNSSKFDNFLLILKFLTQLSIEKAIELDFWWASKAQETGKCLDVDILSKFDISIWFRRNCTTVIICWTERYQIGIKIPRFWTRCRCCIAENWKFNYKKLKIYYGVNHQKLK